MSVESTIKLPSDHNPQLYKALQLMEQQRFIGKNIMNYLPEVRSDLRAMKLSEHERDLFELGIYFKEVLEQEFKNK